jgi:superfamily II DNA or RNA helicase
MNYNEFLKNKNKESLDYGFNPSFMPNCAFDFQINLIEWAVKKGRCGIFADCGLGKTLIQLAWAQNVLIKTNKHVLIVTPLAVGIQTIKESSKFGIETVRCIDGKPTGNAKIFVTNYERLHLFNPSDFSGTVCDESSIIKSMDGVIKKNVTDFMKNHQFRLLCTATAAPNDFVEIGTSSEALGYLKRQEMMSIFFNHDGGETSKWRLKKHAENGPFWQWMSSWSRCLRKPSDIGFSDTGYDLPRLIIDSHIIKSPVPIGELFSVTAIGLDNQRKERRLTIKDRCEKAADIANSQSSPCVLWCSLNDESDLLHELTKDSVNVQGLDSDDEKEEKLLAFQNGQIKRMVTKPKIAGFGLNWQHCNRQVYFPSHSFEQFYQGVRRCWRFGQKNDVTVSIVSSEAESSVISNLNRKAKSTDEMFSNMALHMKNEIILEKKQSKEFSIKQPIF